MPRSIALPVLLLPLLLTACLERDKPAVENVVRPVQAVRVTLENAAGVRMYPAVIRARREAEIGFRAGGRIAQRLVDTGARVSAGEVLARLDPADLELGVRSARADLSSAEAQLEQARADAARSRALRAQGWTAAELDEVKQATFRSAAERVASTRAALKLAQNRLDYAELRAPAAGVVTGIIADSGTVVTEGQSVMRFAEAGALEAEVNFPEGAVADAAQGQASVTVWAKPDAALAAKLRELSPSAEVRLRTYTARYTIEDAPAWLAMGMSATVRLTTGPAQAAAGLPASALADRGNGPMVWVVDPEAGTIAARPVVVHSLQQDRVWVEGVRTGELVVSLGVQKLDPAARVRVADIRPAE
jgi:RND family efflux transporter MFP subunit